jgi:hypothetical protein
MFGRRGSSLADESVAQETSSPTMGTDQELARTREENSGVLNQGYGVTNL